MRSDLTMYFEAFVVSSMMKMKMMTTTMVQIADVDHDCDGDGNDGGSRVMFRGRD